MYKIITSILFSASLFLFSDQTFANHCGGGHKEIKETKEETSETVSEQVTQETPTNGAEE